MSYLANLCAVPGLRGAALFTPDGGCVETRLQPPYEAEYVHDVVQRVLVSMQAIAFLDDTPVKMMMARLSEGALAVMHSPRFLLAALADRNVNPMMLNVALGALESRLNKEPQLVAPSVSHSAVPMARVAMSHPPQSSVSLQSVSDFTLDASQLRQPPPADAVDINTMRALVKITGRYVGPMAKHVLKRELKRMGRGTTSLPRSEFRTLVERVAARIERPDMRAAFNQQCAALVV